MSAKTELWERHNAPNGEHIWCGNKHIADIVTNTDDPQWDKNIGEIARSAVLLHNDPEHKVAPRLLEVLKNLVLVVRELSYNRAELNKAKEEIAKVESIITTE